MSSLAGRMRLVRRSSANRGGPERRHSASSNSSASSWLCPADVDANSRTVDARILGSSWSMASLRSVSSNSGSRSNRAQNASNASSGKSHGLDAGLVTNWARAIATCWGDPCALRSQSWTQASNPGHRRPSARFLNSRSTTSCSGECDANPTSAPPRARGLSLAATSAATTEESSEKFAARHFDATTVDRAAFKGSHMCASNSAVKTRLQQSSNNELPGLRRESATNLEASSTTDSVLAENRGISSSRGMSGSGRAQTLPKTLRGCAIG